MAEKTVSRQSGAHKAAGGRLKRLRLSLFGAVQGVGFRPFVYRLAGELGLKGFVQNGPLGVVIEVEGEPETLGSFERRLHLEKPPAAVIASAESTWLGPAGYGEFAIRPSEGAPTKSAWILPDLAVCPDCLAETSSPDERRHRYPFTNCTNCGPRFTIITGIPYDRPLTTMAGFKMCPDCRKEYKDPADRRFHAQPIACPRCGPRLWLERGKGPRLEGEASLEEAAKLIEEGSIVAMKGIGGFLLICDARSPEAVSRLRERKRRQEKPFALMFPSLESLEAVCQVSRIEAEWLASSAAPIVLLKKRTTSKGLSVAQECAPGNPWLGAMLPYSPLHSLLMGRLGFPVVATSGNLSEEPIAKDNEEAKKSLAGIADAFLMHDRPIARHADDSIVRLSRGRQSVLRRARGFAPLPLRTAYPLKKVLALGAHLKSTVSIGWDRQIVTSQHLGDLESASSWEAFKCAVGDLCALYEFKPEVVACDLHPDYLSTRHAETLGFPIVRVQHHHAHIASLVAEQDIRLPVLGVAWDGIGLGTDGTIWGGEFLVMDEKGFRRMAHLRPFPLPGGEAAIREPRRCALGILHALGEDTERLKGLFGGEWPNVRRLPDSERLSLKTTSAGRLFDAVSSLAGLRQVNVFEGQAAMALEHALEGVRTEESYPFRIRDGKPLVFDWDPLISAILEDTDRGVPSGLVSAKFHNALAMMILEAARKSGLERVALSGGVFQNAHLTERACALLEKDGFKVYTHQRLPPNDGGISAGQALVAGMGWHSS